MEARAGGVWADKNMNRRIPDFDEIKGQETVKRAAMIAAAGFHNLLLSGPPGSGIHGSSENSGDSSGDEPGRMPGSHQNIQCGGAFAR